jgi:hypothetical protein
MGVGTGYGAWQTVWHRKQAAGAARGRSAARNAAGSDLPYPGLGDNASNAVII